MLGLVLTGMLYQDQSGIWHLMLSSSASTGPSKWISKYHERENCQTVF